MSVHAADAAWIARFGKTPVDRVVGQSQGSERHDHGVMGWQAGEKKIRATGMSEVFWS